MEILWNKNNPESKLPTLPKIIELNIRGRKVMLSKGEVNRCIEFLRKDLGIKSEVFIYAMYSTDGKLGFHVIINPENRTIYIPPAALITNPSLPGGGSAIQEIFEKIVSKNNYNLVVCIAASQITGFSQRVVDTLRKEGYYLTPPIGEAGDRVYGIHQSSYVGSGFQELGIDDKDMLEPTTIF